MLFVWNGSLTRRQDLWMRPMQLHRFPSLRPMDPIVCQQPHRKPHIRVHHHWCQSMPQIPLHSQDHSFANNFIGNFAWCEFVNESKILESKQKKSSTKNQNNPWDEKNTNVKYWCLSVWRYTAQPTWKHDVDTCTALQHVHHNTHGNLT